MAQKKVLEPYKERFIKEYHELKERYNKLNKMLVKWDIKVEYNVDKLGFEPNCPYSLLDRQRRAMRAYLDVLEVRAIIEDVEL